MRTIGLAMLSLAPALLQDPPAGPPAAFDLKTYGAPIPWYVTGRGYLRIVAVDSLGRPSLMNGIVAVLETTDPRSKLKRLQVPLVNGVARVKVQWFTPGEHSIRATSKTGLKGEVSGIKVQELPKGIAFKVSKPDPWPKYVWSGGVFRFEAKVEAGGKPLEAVEVSLRKSRGVAVFPHEYYTEENTGNLSGEILPPPFECPRNGANGNGELLGEAPMRVNLFIDANGNGEFDNGEPGTDLPPIEIVEPCPQELIPAALEILKILEAGGSLEPPVESLIVGAEGRKVKERNDLAKIRDARRFLEEQVIGFVNEGKWKGKFSDVRRRLEHLARFLGDVAGAQPAVQRLECSADLMAGNPDVHLLTLDLALQPRQTFICPVGLDRVTTVQNRASGNALIDPSRFTRCFRPRLSSLVVSGFGLAIVIDDRALRFRFKCTGAGTADITFLLTYEPEQAIVISVPENRGAEKKILASQVLNGTTTLGEEVTFVLQDEARCNQDPRIRVDLEILGITEDNEENPVLSFTLVRNDDDDDLNGESDLNQTGPIRKKAEEKHSEDEDNLWPISLRVVGLRDGDVTLTIEKGADNIRVWTNELKDPANNGQITFNGTDNKFRVVDLPKVLWVEGILETRNIGGVKLKLKHSEGPEDFVVFTVLWVTKVTAKKEGKVSPNNLAKEVYEKVAGNLDLGGPRLFRSRLGIAIEYKGTVVPDVFPDPVFLSRDVQAKFYKDQRDGTRLEAVEPDLFKAPAVRSINPRGNDFAKGEPRDTSAPFPVEEFGTIYTIDAPGITTSLPDGVGTIRRMRANFQAFAFYERRLKFTAPRDVAPQLPGRLKGGEVLYIQRAAEFLKTFVRVSAKLTTSQIIGRIDAVGETDLTAKGEPFKDKNLSGATVALFEGDPAKKDPSGFARITANTASSLTLVGDETLKAVLQKAKVFLVTPPAAWVLNDAFTTETTKDNTAGIGEQPSLEANLK